MTVKKWLSQLLSVVGPPVAEGQQGQGQLLQPVGGAMGMGLGGGAGGGLMVSSGGGMPGADAVEQQ